MPRWESTSPHPSRGKEDDQDNEGKGNQESQLYVIDAVHDLDRMIVVNVGFDRRRKRRLRPREGIAHGTHHRHIIGARRRRHATTSDAARGFINSSKSMMRYCFCRPSTGVATSFTHRARRPGMDNRDRCIPPPEEADPSD